MSAPQMRPTFLLETRLDASDAMKCIKKTVLQAPKSYCGQFTSDHAMISMEESRRQFWSPWMHIEIREEPDTRVHVFGRFSPHPSIWTAFMFSYLAIAVLVFFALMFGVSQQMLGLSPWAYYLVPLGPVAAVMLWLASQAGQKLAHDEMEELRDIVAKCVDGGEKFTETHSTIRSEAR